MTDAYKQFPSRGGHAFFCRQLRVAPAFVFAGVVSVAGACLYDLFIVVVDDLFNVVHATVTDFSCDSVEDFPQFMVFVKMFVN